MSCKDNQKVPPRKEVETPIQSGTELEATSGREQNINQNNKKTITRYRAGVNIATVDSRTGRYVELSINEANKIVYPKAKLNWNRYLDRTIPLLKDAYSVENLPYNEWNEDARSYIGRIRNLKLDGECRAMPYKEDKNSPFIKYFTSFRKARKKDIYYSITETYEELLYELAVKTKGINRSVWTGRCMQWREVLTVDCDMSIGWSKEAREKVIKRIMELCDLHHIPYPNLIIINTRINPERDEKDQYHFQIVWYIDDPFMCSMWNDRIEQDESRKRDKIAYNVILDELANIFSEFKADKGYTGAWMKTPFAVDIETERFREVGETVNRSIFEEIFKDAIEAKINSRTYMKEKDAALEKEEDKEDNELISENDPLRYIRTLDRIQIKDNLKEYYISKCLPECCSNGEVSRHLLTLKVTPLITWSSVNHRSEITRELVSSIAYEIDAIAGNLKGTGPRPTEEIEDQIDDIYIWTLTNFDPNKKNHSSKYSDADRAESLRKRRELMDTNILLLTTLVVGNSYNKEQIQKLINKGTELGDINKLSVNTRKRYITKLTQNHYAVYLKLKKDLEIEKEELRKLEKRYANGEFKGKKFNTTFQKELISHLEDVIALYEIFILGYVDNNKKKELINKYVLFNNEESLTTMYYRYFRSNNPNRLLFFPKLDYNVFGLIIKKPLDKAA